MPATAERPQTSRSPQTAFNGNRPSGSGGSNRPPAGASSGGRSSASKGGFLDDAKILFQTYFKSVGPRTYAAQLKEAKNGNHVLVITEGRRDSKTGDVRKIKLLVWSEDFVQFFQLLRDTATFIKSNPVPESVRRRQEKRWAKDRHVAPAK